MKSSSKNKAALLTLISLFALVSVGADAAGKLNTPAGGYVLCISPTTNSVTHPAGTSCPKGYTKLILGAQGTQGAQGVGGI